MARRRRQSSVEPGKRGRSRSPSPKLKPAQLGIEHVVLCTKPGKTCFAKNLFLQVSRSGGRSWVYRYRRNGKQTWMGLGAVADVPLDKAREAAALLRQQRRDKIDPLEARRAEDDKRRKEELNNITFKTAAAKFLDLYEDTWRNAKHRSQWRNTLEAHAYPTLGNRPVRAIDAALINSTLAPIWAKTPETASRVKQRIERVCQWVNEGMPLPAPSMTRRKRPQPALPVPEIPAFMSALRDRDSVSAKALEFAVLTASRPGAVVGARWSEIDVDAKVWTVPMSRAGTKLANRDHRVPLSDRALEILRGLLREDGNDFVFLGGRPNSGLSDMALNESVKEMHAAKLKADGRGWVDPKQEDRRVVPHGVARSSFKDWATTTGRDDLLSEFALAHVDKDKVRASYLRDDLLERRVKLMADWAAYCAQPPNKSNVTVMPQREAAPG